MAIIRANKNKGYTVMSNYHLRDIDLSLEAKGLLSIIIMLGDKANSENIAYYCTEKDTVIKSALKELSDSGYIAIEQ